MDYKTDDEKVEELKAWWKENGTSVVAGVALAVAGLFGWEYWKDWKEATAAEASTLYTEVKQQVDSQSMDKATSGIAESASGRTPSAGPGSAAIAFSPSTAR